MRRRWLLQCHNPTRSEVAASWPRKIRFNPSSQGINNKPLDSQSGSFLQWFFMLVFLKSRLLLLWFMVGSGKKTLFQGDFLLLNFSGCMTIKNLPNGVLGFGGVFQVCIPRTRPPRWKTHVSCRYLHATHTPSNPPGCFLDIFFGMQIHPWEEYIVRNSHVC